jgi:serine protease Do
MKVCARNKSFVWCKRLIVIIAFALTGFMWVWPSQAAADSIGSGFFIGTDGTLMTAGHVVDGCRGLQAEQNGNASSLKVVATEQTNDLAILKSDPAGPVRPLQFRNERTIRVGEPIYVLGFPLVAALGPSASFWTGSVSGLSGIQGDSSRFRITVPLTYGFSGAAVVDQRAEVIGMAVDHLVGLGPGRQSEEIVGIATSGEILLRLQQRYAVASNAQDHAAILQPEEIASRLTAATVLVRCSR